MFAVERGHCLAGQLLLWTLLLAPPVLEWLDAEPLEPATAGALSGQGRHWHQLLSRYRHLDERQLLAAVNNAINGFAYYEDWQNWSRWDHWATPLEFLEAGGGDCEDFSIAKYFALRALGIPVERLRLLYVKVSGAGRAHMVLAYYQQPDAVPLLLDNLTDAIVPADQRPDLLPVYTFNSRGYWLADRRGRGIRVGNSARLSRWAELQRRYRRQQRL
ncbi:transglutaminase-like cysteine peptidase [Gallaecimonas sp. GXIMD4217]|uniref:transglutaminase-like cysteine peptidase n=1 Tax=Gallaecimonas sp. GXIMD4217 TaxID=3131927 RepID=UPI00311B301E